MDSATVDQGTPVRVLLLDDDAELCRLLEEYLESEYFQVESVHDGQRGLERAGSGEHDILILDLMLPGLNGVEVLRQLRRRSDIPILVLSARSDEIDRVVGLELGADDYLPKPGSPRELVARVRSILRRVKRNGGLNQSATFEGPIVVDEVCLDPASRTVTCENKPVNLTSVEFDVLETLLRSAGEVVSRDQLSEDALDRDLAPLDRVIDVHVSRLRKKLGEGPDDQERIKSIRGVGYLYARTSHNR